MSYVVRAPTMADADGLGSVHVRAWLAAYRGGLMPDDYLDALSEDERAAMWRQSLEGEPRSRSARLVAATDDGAVVGFAVVGPEGGDVEAATGELYAINVDPEHWGQGVGTRLLESGVTALVAAGFSRVVLWVHPDNRRARAFYAAHGWEDDGVERRQIVLGVEVPEVRYSRSLP